MHRLIFLSLLLLGCSSPPPATDSIAADSTANANGSFLPSEKDTVRGQIAENWLIDAGLPELETMVAIVIVEMNPDGSVQSTRFDPATIRDDPNWELFAESCRRAVLKASPLRMPPDKPYAAWKTMKIAFSGREMVRPN
jgi:hypothetical protein